MPVLSFDEIHAMAGSLYDKTESLPKKKRKRRIEEELIDWLILGYIDGYRRVYEEGEIPVAEMLRVIYMLIDGETFADRISREIDNKELTREALQRIVDTEWHRVTETGAYNGALAYEALTGLTGYKRWITMNDDRVRDTHWYLEGTEVMTNGFFYTYDGDYARFPSDFKTAENNINCRCHIDYYFR